MRTKIAGWLAATTLMTLVACGGHVAEVGDGGSSGEDGGVACQALPGCAMTSATTCDNGCNQCSCNNGEWACTMRFCPVDSGPPVCPSNAPTSSSYCAFDGQACEYRARDCGGEYCTCSGHRWQCAVSDCPPPVCPAVPPSFGTTCSAVGQSCAWTSGCSSVDCTCVVTSNGPATWQCEGSACVDAGVSDGGHPIDAGSH